MEAHWTPVRTDSDSALRNLPKYPKPFILKISDCIESDCIESDCIISDCIISDSKKKLYKEIFQRIWYGL